ILLRHAGVLRQSSSPQKFSARAQGIRSRNELRVAGGDQHWSVARVLGTAVELATIELFADTRSTGETTEVTHATRPSSFNNPYWSAGYDPPYTSRNARSRNRSSHRPACSCVPARNQQGIKPFLGAPSTETAGHPDGPSEPDTGRHVGRRDDRADHHPGWSG